MKVIGPKAECRIRKRHFKVLFGNIRSIYYFNRYTLFFVDILDPILYEIKCTFILYYFF